MASKKEMASIQKDMQDSYKPFCDKVMKLKNVRGVGIGLKETNGKITDQPSFRVYVNKKIPESSLTNKQVIPSSFSGMSVDVLPLVYEKNLAFVERRDRSKYRPLQGGIAVTTENAGGYGTLGWFGTLNADSKPILLSNDHVLFDNGESMGTKTAQPAYSDPCCCECGVIGKNIHGNRNGIVDAAIAEINSDENISFVINNKSASQSISPTGNTAQAVIGETVKKIGARSGYTEGIVVDIGATTVPPNTPVDGNGNPINLRPNQILILPTASETYVVPNMKRSFGWKGDSGSVVLNSSNDIVGLLFAGDDTNNSEVVVIANNISNVLSYFQGAGFAFTFSAGSGSGLSDLSTFSTGASVIETDISKLEELFDIHNKEVLSIINNSREGKVRWQRINGPQFIAQIHRGFKNPNTKLYLDINGKTYFHFFQDCEQLFKDMGSKQLIRSLNRFSKHLYGALGVSKTVNEFVFNFNSFIK